MRDALTQCFSQLELLSDLCFTFSGTALATVDFPSMFGVYILGGLVIVFTTVVNVSWAHGAFQALVYWSVVSSLVWFVAQAYGRARGIKIE